MNKWIEELKTDNGLIDPNVPDVEDTPISYINGDKEIVLHGVFTIQQLQALTAHMQKYAKEEK